VRCLTRSHLAGVNVVADDISDNLLRAAFESLAVAVDIETTGLAWQSDTIASVQVALPEGPIEIVRIDPDGEAPGNIRTLIESSDIMKVFHHAMFDLRFMRVAWGVRGKRISCTKVASKIADPTGEVGHGLADIVCHYLGLTVDKSQQTSDWRTADLSPEQIEYAANDVRHLFPVLYALLSDLRHRDLETLALRCFDHLPTRVELDVRGLGDVFTY
jgi:ribonuclease D